MKRYTILIVFGFLTLALSQCDFPSDPPAKTDTGIKYLMPLSDTYRFVYLYEPYSGNGQLWADTMDVVTTPDGLYYKWIYRFQDFNGEKPIPTYIVMPPLLRNTEDGLEGYYIEGEDIYQTSISYKPTLWWKFLYPANTGDTWYNTKKTYRITLAAKDTIVTHPDNVNSASCYMYDVSYSKEGKEPYLLYYHISFVPGEGMYLFRNVRDQYTISTYFWAWDDN